MNDRSTAWYLKQIDIFSGISDEEMMPIASKVVERSCQKKELLYTPFQETDFICILKKGEVTLYHTHNGKRYVIDVLTPGTIFGNISFTPKKNDHFAEVTQDAYICFLPIQDFLNILQAKPDVMMRFLKLLSERLSYYEQRLKDQFLDAKEKVTKYLEAIPKKPEGGLLQQIFWKKKRLTKTRIAYETGLSRETVSRIMSELKKEEKM